MHKKKSSCICFVGFSDRIVMQNINTVRERVKAERQTKTSYELCGEENQDATM